MSDVTKASPATVTQLYIAIVRVDAKLSAALDRLSRLDAMVSRVDGLERDNLVLHTRLQAAKWAIGVLWAVVTVAGGWYVKLKFGGGL